MKRLRTIIAVMLSVLLALVSLTACGIKDPEIDWGVDPENSKIPLKVLYPPTGMSDESLNSSYTVDLTKRLTGYDVSYSQLASSSEEQEVGTILQGKQLFNLMKLSEGSYKSYVTEDAFLDLTELLERYGQDILATMSPETRESVTYDGKIYAIPETSFSAMQDNALVFNKSHLAAVGVTKVPETLSEFTETLTKLQNHFSPGNSNYRAFGIPGTLSDCSTISSCFDMPYRFYAEDGNVKKYIYSGAFEKYTTYMNGLVRNSYIAGSWSSQQDRDIMSNFSTELISVAYMPYWNITPLTNTMQKVNSKYSTIEQAKADLEWSVRLKGDGSNGSSVQSAGKYRSDIGNAYFISIPFYMAEQAVYAVHWMNKRIKKDNFLKYLIGEEGVTYNLTTADDANGIAVTYEQETKYYKPTDKYKEYIVGNSMYATGTDRNISAAFWPLREAGFGAWSVLMPVDDTCIRNAMAITPIFKTWSPIEISARSWVVTNVQQIINSKNSGRDTVTERIASVRTQFASEYWKAATAAEVNAWYASKNA